MDTYPNYLIHATAYPFELGSKALLRQPQDTTMTADDKKYEICLVGSGGVGTIVSLVLTQSGGANVTSVLRSKYEAVSEKGWDIDSVDHGKLSGWKPHKIVATIADAAAPEAGQHAPKYDYVVISMKSLPEAYDVADMIEPLVTKGHTAVLLIQNGLGIEVPLLAKYPSNPILSGVSMVGTRTEGSNGILHTATERLILGPHFHDENCPRDKSIAAAETFQKLYSVGGCKSCEVELDMPKARWQKLLWNGSFNTLCALMGMDVGQVLSSGLRESHLLPMMWEMVNIAKVADGVVFKDEKKIVDTLAYGLPDTTPYRPSMLLDTEYGRPMEIEVILGTAVRKAKENGLNANHLENVYYLLKALQWKNEQKALGRHASVSAVPIDGSKLM